MSHTHTHVIRIAAVTELEVFRSAGDVLWYLVLKYRASGSRTFRHNVSVVKPNNSLALKLSVT